MMRVFNELLALERLAFLNVADQPANPCVQIEDFVGLLTLLLTANI